VLSWTLMIANCICMAVVFVQVARKHFLTYSTCACRCTAKVTPARITRALVSVGAGVGAASVRSARVVNTVPDVVALFTVPIVSRRTCCAAVSVARCSCIEARNTGETWSIRTTICVNTFNA
jgi:hypothetical protein